MGSTTLARNNAIRHNQNVLLYKGVKFSVAGSLLAAGVGVYTFGPLASSPVGVWIWFGALYVAYLLRALDCQLFKRSVSRQQHVHHWSRRFAIGALASATAWASAMWLIYPETDQAHQVLLVLTLGAVAGGALASLPYDLRLSNKFQILIFASVVLRLLFDGSAFAYELALFSCFVFGFLISCGREVGKNYIDLLRLRQDSQENNLELIRTTEQMAKLGYWQWDLRSRSVSLSTRLSIMFGYDSSDVDISKVDIRATFSRIHHHDRLKVENACTRVIETGEDVEVECRVYAPNDSGLRDMRLMVKLISDSEGRDTLLGAVQDITDIKSAEQKIYSMAYYDELTGLANRAHFHERLDAEIIQSEMRGQEFAIIYIDLDDFKGVNDSYGHASGDAYLTHFANFLREITRRTDMAARLGGDEFCLLISDVAMRESVEDMVLRCMGYTQQAVQLNNHRIHPRLSIGVALYPDNARLADDLVKCADMAMYTVKLAGKQSYAFYQPEMASESQERVRLEADLRQALAEGQFELWYQPKINIRDNCLMGVEALIRWRHPERGMIQPDLFISTAERVGMIKEIGEWVFATACTQLREWNNMGLKLSMAVNISGDHFIAANFCNFIVKTIELHQLRFQDIEIEITESLSRDPEEHRLICHELRSRGVRIAIDDFGTGYSSLSVLGNLEVDTLKIDKSFIDGVASEPASQLMVRAIIDLALGLGYDIVAEGVESADQLEVLRERGCPYIQGYYFSRPVEASKMPMLFATDWSLARVA
ncbi:putative bifunctional diguanylate cyclase/phosphodiesterase [Granulosicoccus antarcticus]|uniref:Phytochrome-like protein cph2 n=1 Tax=Granulosicoccus antarcticus IMCC3135 TaxID=1192854 RepID=A0A2Z2NXG2_9GAMM|nr:EAL domain-containing protein [Granulosicoccus antarcticus]ASJ76142.1 Phytochrome-like protein cph2 [Granulosicoccus antarcticus IMCC3135]